VPIVLVMPGRTQIGRSWVETHTAHRASDQDILAGFFRQYGITRARDLDELYETSALMLRWPEPSGDGVCIYSMSGGTAAHVADLAAEASLHLPPLSGETQERLREWIPGFLRIDNPVDSGGVGVFDDRHRNMVETLLEAPEVDILVVPIPGSIGEISDKFARDVVEAAESHDKRVCVVWGSPVGTESAYREVLLPSGIPVFRTYSNCLSAIRAYLDHHRARARRASADSGERAIRSASDGLERFRVDATAAANAATDGLNVSIEIVSDALFPAAVALELGEAHVESLRDRVVAIVPLAAGDAEDMLGALRGIERLTDLQRSDLVEILEHVASVAAAGDDSSQLERITLRAVPGAGVVITS
jgi:acyl-CoA synthetase (NDP forming)